MKEFVVRNWGNLASVAGLFFSLLAFIFSRRAADAAKEAREAVLRQTMGEDMNQANRLASEIVMHVANSHGEAALLRARDLHERTSYLLGRWRLKLPEDSRHSLSDVHSHVGLVVKQLSTRSFDALTSEEKTRLAEACQLVSSMLSREHGAAVQTTDRQG